MATCIDTRRTILLTGATGYLGSLIAASYIRDGEARVIAVLRAGQDEEDLLEPLRLELESEGQRFGPFQRGHLSIVRMAAIESVGELAAQLDGVAVDDVVHCAGCLDYFDSAALERVNVQFTERMLDLAKVIGARRFVYVSTAYSCGYIDGVAREALHHRPPSDPTEYTRTKREAEWRVAGSGMPYLIVRPSILVGDSKTGRYSGKRYGLYQQWMGLERLLCGRYHEEYHVVAPVEPLNFVHQDAFIAAFRRACRSLEENAIVHVASRRETSPTLREMWEMWLSEVARPQRVFYYEKLDDVPLASINPRQRAFLMFASVNVEISAHRWEFASGHLEQLRGEGLEFCDASLSSLRRCQQRFVHSSSRMRAFLDEHAERFSETPLVIDHPAAARAAS